MFDLTNEIYTDETKAREHLEALGLQPRMDEQVAIQELPEILLPPEKSTRFQSDLRFVGWVVILTAFALGGLYYYHRVKKARMITIDDN